jgi:hypothetical protein
MGLRSVASGGLPEGIPHYVCLCIGINGPSSLPARRRSSPSDVSTESDSTNGPEKGSFGGGSWLSWPTSRTSDVGLPSENRRSEWTSDGSRCQPSACMPTSVIPVHCLSHARRTDCTSGREAWMCWRTREYPLTVRKYRRRETILGSAPTPWNAESTG